jgi:hypothetical protein
MSDATLKLPDDTANLGVAIDLESLTVGANIVKRERLQLAGASALEIARVKATAPATGDMGLVVRPVGMSDSAGVDMTDTTNNALRVYTVKELDNVAHGAADVGGPNKIGGKAVTSVSGQTPVDNNDRTDHYAGVDGVPIVRLDCNLEDIVTGTLTNTDGTSNAVIAAQGAGIKTYLRSIDIFNTSGAGVVVELKDGSTVKKTYYVPTVGGLIRRFDPPLPGTANTAWNIDPAGATSTLYANGEGFKSRV